MSYDVPALLSWCEEMMGSHARKGEITRESKIPSSGMNHGAESTNRGMSL
jgi:hypothetical protein